MTGFGRGVTRSVLGTITTEIKTVNHRYLDLIVKLPRELQGLDPKIKECIKGAIQRGRVEIYIERSGGEGSVSAEINRSLARTYLTNLQMLGKEFKLKDTPSLSLLCQMPGMIELRTPLISTEKAWKEVKSSIDRALKALIILRKREGKIIEKDIKDRVKKIRKKQEEIEKRLPLMLDRYREELKTKLAELSGKIDNEKLSTEIGILSEKVDISEELLRFSSHLNLLCLFLNEKEDTGKKIIFTLQEMMREVNTMAAKANDFPVSRAVIFIKSELEKIKEQVQNIE